MPPAAKTAAGPPVRSVHQTMRIMSIATPVFLALCVGYTLYVMADFILMHQFFHQYHYPSLALGLLVPYVIFAALMVASFLRITITLRRNPGVVPLGPESARNFYGARSGASGRRTGRRRRGDDPCARRGGPGCFGQDRKTGYAPKPGRSVTETPSKNGLVDLEAGLASSVPYDAAAAYAADRDVVMDPRLDPDSPGLELFYTKDVFECTPDGRPVWCHPCGTWKPDRTHHCSEINRCVRKMDHYCPWVGGIVSETTFKFFVQFTFYATLVCGFIIATCAYAIWRRKAAGVGTDGRIISALALACVLGMFAFAMSLTCIRFVLINVTTVESHQIQDRTKTMAVRIQRGSPPVEGRYGVVTYPLPKYDAQLGYSIPAVGALGPVQGTASPNNGNGNYYNPPPPPPPQGDYPPERRENGGNVPPHAPAEEEDPFKIAREARAARRALRDQLAFRTFAVVTVPRGMNVWDLGWRQNWTSIMGTNVLDWLLPLRSSPCCSEESTSGFYRVGPEFKKLCADLDLPPCSEMEQVANNR
ncbi:dhhc zinc finger membrane protein [Niveomyces insectorum RCEF 264]|uniref:Palmitoyltransferase n=1 Tax=Niveomyces insectorum RCEF 264 TaxID=1081102 RepID=A0A162MKJ1_9HYPO|nr:dhhc zinc finger membrane protein [Niveomyces insectorum RCEF 264]